VSDVQERKLELARHYSEIGQYRRTLELLGGSDAFENAEGWMLRGEALYQLDRYSEGADAARRGLELEPEDTTLLDVLALNLIELGDLAGAEQALLAALELWPDNETLLGHYALACARGGQAEKASQLIDRAARLNPTSTDVLRVRAQIAYVNGDKKLAKQYAEELLAVEPEDRIGHVLRGNVLVEGDIFSAVRHFDEAVRLDPTDHDTAHAARHNRVLTHWLQWPIYPILRFGPIKVWVAYLAVLGLVTATGQTTLFLPLVALYLFLVVYSWTVAPLARWWMHRRAR
jgi:tetratricopeptide (TPR) repeat protein